MNDNSFLWSQFIRLGEMIGDGLHYEEPWISKEYKKLSKILLKDDPELKRARKEQRRIKNANINEAMQRLIKNNKCGCGGELKQSRSGSYVCYCNDCNKRYKGKRK